MRPSVVRVWFALALALATVAVYARAVGFGFTGLDDQGYVSANHFVLEGLTARSVSWALRTFYCANWHPLTWLSLMLDAQIGGSSPAIYHTTNVLLHVLNTLLLFAALVRLTGRAARSAFAAALFALHPLHVESVAWIAERKDVLSTAFMLLAILAYAGYAKRPSTSRYLKVLLLFACGLLAKPMLVSFPILLLLLDWWPLGRFHGPGLSRLAREKIPFFALAVLSSAITIVAQSRGGAVQSFDLYPLWTRILNAIVSYAVYLVKVAWPTHLTMLYPHPGTGIKAVPVVASAAMLAALATLAARNTRTRPYLPVGLLWYAVSLVPVIGIVQVGAQARADRYTYVPLIGIFVAVAWFIPDLLEKRAGAQRALRAVAIAVLLALAGASFVQAGYWRNRLALFDRMNAAIPNYPLAQNTLGVLLFDEGATQEAEKHFRAILAENPKHAGAHNNVAMCLLKTGKAAEGLSHLDEALRLDPGYAKARENRARALLALGRVDESVRDYLEALQLEPKSATAHTGYAEALIERGDAPAAASSARAALEIAPRYSQASHVLGVALLLQGNLNEAVDELRRATDAAPEFADAHANLAGALIQQGRLDEAAEHCRVALRITPDHAGAHTNLGLSLMRLGRTNDARAEFTEVRRLRPGDERARRYLRELGERVP